MDIKKIALIATILVIAGGCTSSPTLGTPTENAAIQSAPPTSQAAYKFTIITGAAESDWYAEGSRASSEINTQTSTVFSSVKESHSLMENVDLLTAGKAGMAFVYDYHVALANQGKLMSAFPDAPMEKITIKCGTEMTRPMFPEYAEAARIVLPLYEEQLHIVVSEASGIKSVSDFKGKHISTGEAGSATEQQARFVFNGLGMDWDTEILREPFDLPTAIEAIKKGEIDAFLASVQAPNFELVELLQSDASFTLISITGDEAENIIQSQPNIFHQSNIPAGTYNTISGDVSMVATTVTLAAMEDFPNEHVSAILAALFTESAAATPLKTMLPATPEASIALLRSEVRVYLHPGASDYFTKQGVLR